MIEALTPWLGDRAARLDAVAAGRLYGMGALLEEFFDPHNVGAALRSCEAMGVPTVHVIIARYPFRVSTRVTQGCERWLEVHRHRSVEESVAALHAAGFHLYAAVPGAPLAVGDLPTDRKIALAFGNEHLGLSPRLRALADGEFSIPMHGASQSLNVSVSVAISLHAATEARRRALGRPGDLDDDALLRLRARYYASDVRGARGLVEHLLRTRAAGC